MHSDHESSPQNSERDAANYGVQDNPELIAEGWERRHLADPQRAAEALELYSSLGFEVKTHQLTPADFGPECRDCALSICTSYVIIYTRKKNSM